MTKKVTREYPAGGFRNLARRISAVENESPGYEKILEGLPARSAVPVIGLTGPPGAGKSTLIDAMLSVLLSPDSPLPIKKGVGVITVDPSSPFTSGALLGDRLRMSRHFNHPGVYIRSLATRGSLGGLSYKTLEVADVMKSWGFDLVLVETVGVGQSEMEIAALADVTVLVLVPESGDDVQVVKAGLMEAADVFVVNKADREGAGKLESYLRDAAGLDPGHARDCPVIETVATESKGVPELIRAVLEKHSMLDDGQKERLLFEKAVRLIRDYQLKRIDREKVKKALKAHIGNGGSIYSFARAYAEGNGTA
jgi:LAO/AO transport system kinase